MKRFTERKPANKKSYGGGEQNITAYFPVCNAHKKDKNRKSADYEKKQISGKEGDKRIKTRVPYRSYQIIEKSKYGAQGKGV